MPLCDAHNHLHDPRFGGRQAELVAALRDAGVARCVVNGTRPDDWPAVARLADRFPDFVVPAFGLHPWHAGDPPRDWLESLAGWLDRFPHASLGECGVDRWVREPPLDCQIAAFSAQLALAAGRRLPLSIHCLMAWGALLDCLAAAPPLTAGFLVHSFGGSRELVRQLVPLGASFSFSGHFLDPRKATVVEAFRHVPADRLLLESDAPDMLPPAEFVRFPLAAPDGTPVNHPANLAAIATAAAAALGHDPADLRRQTTANFHRLFAVDA